jgi:predicted RNase H-like HicB family nuclease
MTFDLIIEHDVEDDGRLIADIPALPGCTVYGKTSDETIKEVVVLALHVIASRVAHGEFDPLKVKIQFSLADGRVDPEPHDGPEKMFHFEADAKFRAHDQHDALLRLSKFYSDRFHDGIKVPWLFEEGAADLTELPIPSAECNCQVSADVYLKHRKDPVCPICGKAKEAETDDDDPFAAPVDPKDARIAELEDALLEIRKRLVSMGDLRRFKNGPVNE